MIKSGDNFTSSSVKVGDNFTIKWRQFHQYLIKSGEIVVHISILIF
jgi:hypothetical protein